MKDRSLRHTSNETVRLEAHSDGPLSADVSVLQQAMDLELHSQHRRRHYLLVDALEDTQEGRCVCEHRREETILID